MEVDSKTVLRFVAAVEEMFKDDPNWSILDLDGAPQLYEALGTLPDVDAASVETDAPECPECGESGYETSAECMYCEHIKV